MTNNGDKKTCATCVRLDGSICKLDGFCIGSLEHGAREKYKQRPSSVGSENTGARQAITNDERREIAARLRQRSKEMDNEKPPRNMMLAAAVYLLEISTAVGCDESGELFYRLADLIDPQTISRKKYTADELRERRNRQHYESLVRCGRASICPECGGYTTSDNGYHIRCAKKVGIPIKRKHNA